MTSNKTKTKSLEKISVNITKGVGTPASIVVHTLIFLTFTGILLTGFNFEKVLLVWNTMVSLEAIYLAIFIQMTVNRNTQSLEGVEEDIEDISEDVEDISEDIEDIQEEDKEDEVVEAKTQESLNHIQKRLQSIMNEVESLKKVPPHALPRQ